MDARVIRAVEFHEVASCLGPPLGIETLMRRRAWARESKTSVRFLAEATIGLHSTGARILVGRTIGSNRNTDANRSGSLTAPSSP
jgi:hypothetical protein